MTRPPGPVTAAAGRRAGVLRVRVSLAVTELPRPAGGAPAGRTPGGRLVTNRAHICPSILKTSRCLIIGPEFEASLSDSERAGLSRAGQMHVILVLKMAVRV